MLKLVREAQAAQQLIVHHPVLLKLDCVQKWVETGNWSHTGLLRHKDTNETLTVKKNKQRFFMYQEQGREHFLHDTKSEQEFITMSFGEFLNNVKAQKDSPAWYFTSQVQNLSPSLLYGTNRLRKLSRSPKAQLGRRSKLLFTHKTLLTNLPKKNLILLSR